MDEEDGEEPDTTLQSGFGREIAARAGAWRGGGGGSGLGMFHMAPPGKGQALTRGSRGGTRDTTLRPSPTLPNLVVCASLSRKEVGMKLQLVIDAFWFQILAVSLLGTCKAFAWVTEPVWNSTHPLYGCFNW